MGESDESSFGARLSAETLGRGLRRLRNVAGGKTLSLDQIVARQDVLVFTRRISRSALHRYEAGGLPPLASADQLDQMYQAKGWVSSMIHALWRSDWDPWRDALQVASRRHTFSWPAPYAGEVWILIKGQAKSALASHRLIVSWGNHVHRGAYVPSTNGVLLSTGKAADVDGIPVPVNLSSDRPVFVLHGVGEVDTSAFCIDIRASWYVRPRPFGPHDGLE